MSSPPSHHRGISLAFAQRMVQIHIAKAHHSHRGQLDYSDRAARRIDDDLPQSGAEQRLTLALVVKLRA